MKLCVSYTVVDKLIQLKYHFVFVSTVTNLKFHN